jgi:hypothetical protein
MMNWVGTKTIKHFVVITRRILFIEIYKGGLLTHKEVVASSILYCNVDLLQLLAQQGDIPLNDKIISTI